MDVLIYFCGILDDLVVADLNPARPPSFLKKSTRFRDVRLSHTQTFLSQAASFFSCFRLLYTYKTTQGFYLSFCEIFWVCKCCLPAQKVKKGVRWAWVQDCKVSLSVYAEASKGKRTNHSQLYWFIPPLESSSVVPRCTLLVSEWEGRDAAGLFKTISVC